MCTDEQVAEGRQERLPEGIALVDQVGQYLRERGETHPVPILGGFVSEARPHGRVRVSWRLPGPPAFGGVRRHRALRRYERLLRAWGMATELCHDEPEPYLTCWIARR